MLYSMDELHAEWMDLTKHVLPALAKARGYPIRFDHCFMRVILDHLFQDCWYNHLKKPAINNMTEEQLRQAIEIARGIRDNILDVVELNNASLIWRKKKRK